MKTVLTVGLLAFASVAHADWVTFATRSNGDVHFYDTARVQHDGAHVHVWTRVRYKRSVMAASSYQSHLRLDCTAQSEVVLQSTFFTDADWAKPAMATNTNPKPKTRVVASSPSGALLALLCTD
ncbi:MAG: surface-adhesin E family protein [Pseudomonadota bacterium]